MKIDREEAKNKSPKMTKKRERKKWCEFEIIQLEEEEARLSQMQKRR